MDFILNESVQEEDEFLLSFSDNSDGDLSDEEEYTATDEEFIDDSFIEEDDQQDASFYRNLDNRDEYMKFYNQTKNPIEVVSKEHTDNFGDDNQPELYDPEDKKQVDFDLFHSDTLKSRNFKESLLNFSNVENKFFYAVIYGIMHMKLKGIDVKLENIKETLGDKLFFSLKEIEILTRLDHSLLGFFERCQKMNEILSEHSYFLRFYERQNKFRFQLRKKLKGKDESKREISACVVQKFNGYELLRSHLNSNESQNFVPVDIVYEPTLDDTKEIDCYFAHDLSLAFHCKADKFRRGKKKNFEMQRVRQCYYCNSYFVKSYEKLQKHISCCSGQAGFTYSFDNGKIIDYQDHYTNLGDVPFSVYYDFETTTGSAGFLDVKMFVVSYCMVVVFHAKINLPRIVIYRSFNQTENELQSLSPFQILDYDFFNIEKNNFNRISLKQLQDAAYSVFNKGKNISLAEMPNVELKFTVDCIKNWISKNHKV